MTIPDHFADSREDVLKARELLRLFGFPFQQAEEQKAA